MAIIQLPKSTRIFGDNPPEPFNALFIDYAKHNNNSALHIGSAFLGDTGEDLLWLDKIKAKRSPLDNPAQHFKKVRDKIEEVQKRIDNGRRRALNVILDELKTVIPAIEAKANLKPNSYATEIRAALKAMKTQSERNREIDKAIANNDAAFLAAIIDAPEVVTGIPTNRRDVVKEQYFAKVAPTEVALRDELRKAHERIYSSITVSTRAFVKLGEGLNEHDAEIAAAKEVEDQLNSRGSAPTIDNTPKTGDPIPDDMWQL